MVIWDPECLLETKGKVVRTSSYVGTTGHRLSPCDVVGRMGGVP